MASKLLGLGTVVGVDENDGGSVFTTITLITDFTPPGRKRARIDGTTLTDTLSTYEGGIEEHSEFSFRQFWEPEDTQHASIDTLFGLGSATAGKVLWNITYTSAAPGTIDSFEGWVSDLEPQTIVKDGIVSRVVTVQRTGAITRT
jgi:hypothetical protein